MIADTLMLLPRTNGNLGVWLPAILGVPLLLAGLFFSRLQPATAQGWGRALKLVFIYGYVSAALFFCAMSAFLFSQGHAVPPASADAVIVLGCGVRGTRVSLTLQYRLDAAIVYLEENPGTLVVVSGGQGPGELIPEAEAMALYLADHGIAPTRILLEDTSLSTLENFTNSKALLDQHFTHPYRVVFVTSRFHVYRAGRTAAALGLSADGLGSKILWYIAPNDYLRESIAVAAYALLGRL